MRSAPKSTNLKTKICLIFVIFMLSKKFSLYVTSPKTFKILNNSSLAKSNLSLSYII